MHNAKRKYEKPLLEMEYYTLDTTIASTCGTTTDGDSGSTDQEDEDSMFASTFSTLSDSCDCYTSYGDSGDSYVLNS